jgi:hypothetical protein
MENEVLKINANGKTLWLDNDYGQVFSKFDFLNDEQVILSICGNQKNDDLFRWRQLSGFKR